MKKRLILFCSAFTKIKWSVCLSLCLCTTSPISHVHWYMISFHTPRSLGRLSVRYRNTDERWRDMASFRLQLLIIIIKVCCLGCSIRRLYICRRVGTLLPVGLPIGSGWLFVIPEDVILMAEGSLIRILSGLVTRKSLLRNSSVLDELSEKPFPINQLVMSSSSTYIIKSSPYSSNCSYEPISFAACYCLHNWDQTWPGEFERTSSPA